MACDAQAAITGGRCFCLGAKQVECIRVYLLALWAGLSTDPNTMAGLASNLGGLNVKDRAQIDTYLLSVIAGASSDPNTLATAAKGFVIDGGQHQYYQIQDSLLCSLAGASCVPNTLAILARGFDGYGYEQLGQVATYCLAVKAGVSTSANALLALAKGFQGTPLKMLFQEQAWLLCGLAACSVGAVSPSTGTINGFDITLSWTASPDVDPVLDWIINYGVDSGGPYPFSHSVASIQRSETWQDGAIDTNNNNYYFVITKRDGADCTATSEEIQLFPS